jgi:excisionase family DNA binding protein
MPSNNKNYQELSDLPPPLIELLSNLPPFLTADEVAELLRVSRRTINDFLAQGRLDSMKITPGPGSGRRLIPREAVAKFLSSATR